MLTKRIIPCLDVKDGRVVKGVNFVDLVDKGDPAEHARRYDEEGADEITLLDITATTEGRRAMLDVVARTAEATFTPLTVGGGIQSEADVEALLEAGADKVSLNSAAVRDPELVARCAKRWGTQAIVVAIDVKRDAPIPGVSTNWEVYTRGGRTRTDLAAVEWVKRVVDLGAGEILLTSMDRDGTLAGYDLDLLRAIRPLAGVPVIASGGAGTLEHLREAAAEGASGILAASIFHDGTFSIGEAKDFLARAGIPMRIAPATAGAGGAA
ncbi:MAG: imidazole glycerol phosphate synthase subunit HisF [Labilithrix sp.]|nr:imidazole glycerol phosphate synthase subunit HisF [Labilithrix sp.]